jgi:hypothetical protein
VDEGGWLLARLERDDAAAGEAGPEAELLRFQPLLKLDDSHTKFYPPERLTKTDYGWTAIMIGDDPYVGWVRKKSDAEAKGLRRGDRILHWNTLVRPRGRVVGVRRSEGRDRDGRARTSNSARGVRKTRMTAPFTGGQESRRILLIF